MTPQERTAKANEVRRRKFLERKAGEYAAALRELGYTVTAPGAHFGSSACPLCSGVNGHASICDDYGRDEPATYEPCGCLTNSAGAHRKGCKP